MAQYPADGSPNGTVGLEAEIGSRVPTHAFHCPSGSRLFRGFGTGRSYFTTRKAVIATETVLGAPTSPPNHPRLRENHWAYQSRRVVIHKTRLVDQ